jgi:hypothetical protein
MEDVLVLKRTEIFKNEDYETNESEDRISQGRIGLVPSKNRLLAKCGINFFRYLKSLNFSNEPDILVLPSNQHYYYEGKELESIKTLINLKKLNLIKHVDMFLNTLVRVLPKNANFIGCFSDNKPTDEDGFKFNLLSNLFSRFTNLLDSKTDHFMNKQEVSELLERNGFKTIDMKEMDGLTYFYCITSRIMLK